MPESADAPDRGTGVVTFLDVLGWKGVYDRKKDALDSLTRIVSGLEAQAEEKRGRVNDEVSIKSISDTVAIFTACVESDASVAIAIHGELCAWLIPRSIFSELPMRGATAFGEFEVGQNIFVGKAVDEAASWHEQSDWMGVHLTPSAEYVFNPAAGQTVWIPYAAPVKSKLNWRPHCVNWTRDWRSREDEIARLKIKFRRLGPIVPEIAAKFVNTLTFVETVTSSLHGF